MVQCQVQMQSSQSNYSHFRLTNISYQSTMHFYYHAISTLHRRKLTQSQPEVHTLFIQSQVNSCANSRNSSAVRVCLDIPIILLERSICPSRNLWNRAGMSFSFDRSPVTPKMTISKDPTGTNLAILFT